MVSESESDVSVATSVRESSTEQDRSTVAEAESVGTDSSIPSTSSAKTLLNSLRQPTPSKLARIRKVQCNPPTGRKHSAAGSSAFAPAPVRPIDRVKQYPNKQFIVSAKKFFVQHARKKYQLKRA